jgi:hypothetical protein
MELNVDQMPQQGTAGQRNKAASDQEASAPIDHCPKSMPAF